MADTKYYALYDTEGTLITVGTVVGGDPLKGEITKEEYERLKTELDAGIPEPEDVADPEIEEALAILRGEVTE